MQILSKTPPVLKSVARFDIYCQVHKGLRAFLGATLDELGRLDSTDVHEVKRVLDQVDELLDFCIGHLEKENHYVHTALEAYDQFSTKQVTEEHEKHVLAIRWLRADVHNMACAAGPARERMAIRLYRAFALFVAENLEHMEIEESRHNPILWAHFTDLELAAIHAAIVAATSPAHMALSARWIVPNLSPTERTELIAGLCATMPRDIFEASLEMIRPHLAPPEWKRLSLLFGLAHAKVADPADNPALVRRFIEAVFVRFDSAEASELVTGDFISHPWAAMGIPPGPAGIGPVVAAFRTAFDQVQVTLDDVLAEGDRVALRYRYGGRHCGDLFGIPATDRSFDMAGILIARVAQGKVAEYWRQEDMLGLQQQLGLHSLLPA
jgi:predicted ester cyclase